MNTFIGALLVGGKSRRMGRDKCTLEFDGQPLWQRQLAILREAGMDGCLLAPERPDWCPADVPWFADLAPGNGPLGGLAAALQASPQSHVILLGVDLPQMTADYLRKLQTKCGPKTGVVPEMNRLFQPLSAIYPTSIFPQVRAHLASPDKSFQNLIRELVTAGCMQVLSVDDSERLFFRNLNTPLD